MKIKLLVLFLLWGNAEAFGQYKQMLHKPYKEKVSDIDRLYQTIIDNGVLDSASIQAYSQEMAEWALDNQDEELALEAKLLKSYAYWHIFGINDPGLVQNLILTAEEGKMKKILHIEARAVRVIATHYWEAKAYEKSFEWLLRLASILDEMEPESFPNMVEHLNYIGRCYYYFQDYASALTYYEKSSAQKKTPFNYTSVFEAQVTLGLCYQKLEQLSHAEDCFLAVINDSSRYSSAVWKGIASGNLGYNYYMMGDLEKATPLFLKDIENALVLKDYGLAAGSAIPLADVYLQQHKLQESKQKIEEAKAYIRKSGQTDRLRKLYPVMSKWYATNNQADSSTAYLDSTMLAIKDHNLKYSTLKLFRANQKVEARDRQLQIEKLNTESKLRVSQRNYIIVVIVVLLIGSMIAFWFRTEYLIEKQQVNELTLENTKKALFHSKRELKNLALKVREDNNLILELKKNDAVEVNSNLISQLKSKSILTPEDWEQYQSLFNKVYPNFSPSLSSSYPQLSQAEIRCLCLEKLQLSNTEMALVLGVSANSIRVTKHRIRKKLALESQEEVEALIRNLT